jgi:hypothetical protein
MNKDRLVVEEQLPPEVVAVLAVVRDVVESHRRAQVTHADVWKEAAIAAVKAGATAAGAASIAHDLTNAWSASLEGFAWRDAEQAITLNAIAEHAADAHRSSTCHSPSATAADRFQLATIALASRRHTWSCREGAKS